MTVPPYAYAAPAPIGAESAGIAPLSSGWLGRSRREKSAQPTQQPGSSNSGRMCCGYPALGLPPLWPLRWSFVHDFVTERDAPVAKKDTGPGDQPADLIGLPAAERTPGIDRAPSHGRSIEPGIAAPNGRGRC